MKKLMRRNQIMRSKIVLFILLTAICILNLANHNMLVFANTYSEISTPARSMVVIEGNTNTVLYSHDMHTRLPMASTTKIATCILAIENCENLDEKFLVSDNAVGIEGTSIYIKSGEHLSMRELLYGLMLASGNDCAVAIAEYFGGLDVFVDMMNNFAVELELQNTHFDNPHGLDSSTHYTSAYDLAIITSYALKNPIFREIVSTERYVIPANDVYQARYLKHKNKLLFLDDKCIGVKTGFTDNAGRCLVHAHDENGMMIISVVLNCQPMFEECDRLTKLAMSNYTMKEFIKPYNYVSSVDILDSKKSNIGIITVEGYYLPILKDEEGLYEVRYNLPDNLVAPIALNEVVGSVEVTYNGDIIYSGDLITIEGADNNDIKYLFDNIIDRWF